MGSRGRSIQVHSFHGSYLRPKLIIMSGIGNRCQSRRLWKNGTTGWREQDTHFWYLPATKIWNTFATPANSTHVGPDGRCFSQGSSLRCHFNRCSIPPSAPTCPEPILPSSVVITPVRWDLVEEIQQAQADKPPPLACPEDRLFIPTSLRHWVMQ